MRRTREVDANAGEETVEAVPLDAMFRREHIAGEEEDAIFSFFFFLEETKEIRMWIFLLPLFSPVWIGGQLPAYYYSTSTRPVIYR